MATAVPLELRRLVQEASALAGVVRGSLGPQGGQVLLTRPTGEVLLSRDGRRVLEALNVDSPTARMMIACISTHSSLIGDGAKTFIILLSTLLKELEKLAKGDNTFFCENSQGREKRKGRLYRLKQISQLLMMIQSNILDNIMAQKLAQHFLSFFAAPCEEISRESMRLVLEAYFCGKVGYNRQKFLSELTSDFYFKVTANKNRREVLCLVDECFSELHVTVTGLPVSSSHILEGLVLPRDFAIYCPSDGEKRVLIVTESIHSSLSELGVEVMVTSKRQYEASEIWIRKRTEALIKHMHSNNIRVLLSSVKQQETVHYYAKNYGISLVECLSSEVISFICRITNISPFMPSLDNICSEITDTVVITLCQPLQLGAKRFVHIRFAKTSCALQLHYLIFCGPVHGVTKQHACTFHGAFKMLQHMFTALPLIGSFDSKPERENFSKAMDNCQQCLATQQHTNCSIRQASTMQLKPCEFKMEKISVASPSTVGRELACSSGHLQKLRNTSVHFDLQHDVLCSILHKSEDTDVGLKRLSQTYKGLKEVVKVAENELTENDQFASTTVLESSSLKTSCTKPDYVASLSYKENNKSYNQMNSKYYIKAGSVLPVGGIFEILLHYYLSDYAKQCQSPNVSVLCVLIANVLLSIPKTLCRAEKRNVFPQLYLEVTTAVRDNRHLPNQKYLESVSCKYQLIVSVLHCAARLLGIDLIIGIKRLPQKAEDNDSDIDL